MTFRLYISAYYLKHTEKVLLLVRHTALIYDVIKTIVLMRHCAKLGPYSTGAV